MNSKIIVLLVSFLVTCHSLYFYIDYNQPKCVLESVVDNTPLVFHYKNSDFFMFNDYSESDESDKVDNVKIDITDPEGVVSYETTAKESGKFVFTPYKKGYYKVCTKINKGKDSTERSYADGGEFRFYFDIKRGVETMNATVIARASDIAATSTALDQLTSAIKNMKNELEYQNEEEQKVRDKDDETNNKLMMWSIIEATVLILVAFWQVYSIRSYLFKSHII
ncbi:hypothetical protein WA158_007424 [Blastocystis sp. Blastoise]